MNTHSLPTWRSSNTVSCWWREETHRIPPVNSPVPRPLMDPTNGRHSSPIACKKASKYYPHSNAIFSYTRTCQLWNMHVAHGGSVSQLFTPKWQLECISRAQTHTHTHTDTHTHTHAHTRTHRETKTQADNNTNTPTAGVLSSCISIRLLLRLTAASSQHCFPHLRQSHTNTPANPMPTPKYTHTHTHTHLPTPCPLPNTHTHTLTTYSAIREEEPCSVSDLFVWCIDYSCLFFPLSPAVRCAVWTGDWRMLNMLIMVQVHKEHCVMAAAQCGDLVFTVCLLAVERIWAGIKGKDRPVGRYKTEHQHFTLETDKKWRCLHENEMWCYYVFLLLHSLIYICGSRTGIESIELVELVLSIEYWSVRLLTVDRPQPQSYVSFC